MPGGFTGHATRRYESSEMHEVIGGCKICGKRMLTDRSPLVHRTCDACKAEHRRENNRRSNARRKAERHAAKAAMEAPRCEQCGKVIEGANRDTTPESAAMGAQVLRQHMQAGRVPRPQRLIARCQTAFASLDTRPCQSAGAMRFGSRRAVNPGSSIGTIYRAGACGRISSRANRLWSWPRHLPGLSATRTA